MHYGEIKTCDIANGPGVRVSLFVSGCTHHCKGCFNPQTWDFSYGKPFTEQTVQTVLCAMEPSYIAGITLLGGEPMEISNQPVVTGLLREVRRRFPQKTVWCYTGYRYDVELCPGGSVYTDCTEELLSLIDVLVDGEFVEAQKDVRLVFRGSANQRIIDLRASTPAHPVLWEQKR